MGTLAALGSALCIGTADFVGGWASRRANPLVITMWINVVAASTLAIACLVAQPRLSSSQAIGALLGGCASALSINLVYASFAAGAMTLTAPLIACGTAIVPTVTATVVGQPPGPIQGVGIAFALAGVVAITWSPPASTTHIVLSRRALILTGSASLVSGAAFSILLLAAKGGVSIAVGVSGLSRAAALLVCLLFVIVARARPRLPSMFAPRLLGAGLLEASGVGLFLIASSLGNTAVVAVLGSLYAVVTVLLAQSLLRERVAAHQGWGIAMAATGVVLLSVG